MKKLFLLGYAFDNLQNAVNEFKIQDENGGLKHMEVKKSNLDYI